MNETWSLLSANLPLSLDRSAVLIGDDISPKYCKDFSRTTGDMPIAVFRPKSTSEVAAIIKLCADHKQPIVVQGGRTGLSGGARPNHGEIVLSLERMVEIDPINFSAATIVVDAGVPLQMVQETAANNGLFFGIDLGARGSATIGGNIATNAGGTRALRYGTFRSQLLGLEAVLPDGSVINTLNGLVKDNSGYNLTQLLAGTEGTLGVITRACLRLHPAPAFEQIALCSLSSTAAALKLLMHMRATIGSTISAFEIVYAPLLKAAAQMQSSVLPVESEARIHVLIEIQGMNELIDSELFLTALNDAMEQDLISDAVMSQSKREFDAIWSLRDACSEYLFKLPNLLSLDISLPLQEIENFLTTAKQKLSAIAPSAHAYVFGHLGDGNIHYVVSDAPDDAAEVIFRCVSSFGGAITAEHGVGQDKKPYLHHTRNASEISAMQTIKRSLDPANILNRGRIFDLPMSGANL